MDSSHDLLSSRCKVFKVFNLIILNKRHSRKKVKLWDCNIENFFSSYFFSFALRSFKIRSTAKRKGL